MLRMEKGLISVVHFLFEKPRELKSGFLVALDLRLMGLSRTLQEVPMLSKVSFLTVITLIFSTVA